MKKSLASAMLLASSLVGCQPQLPAQNPDKDYRFEVLHHISDLRLVVGNTAYEACSSEEGSDKVLLNCLRGKLLESKVGQNLKAENTIAILGKNSGDLYDFSRSLKVVLGEQPVRKASRDCVMEDQFFISAQKSWKLAAQHYLETSTDGGESWNTSAAPPEEQIKLAQLSLETERAFAKCMTQKLRDHTGPSQIANFMDQILKKGQDAYGFEMMALTSASPHLNFCKTQFENCPKKQIIAPETMNLSKEVAASINAANTDFECAKEFYECTNP